MGKRRMGKLVGQNSMRTAKVQLPTVDAPGVVNHLSKVPGLPVDVNGPGKECHWHVRPPRMQSVHYVVHDIHVEE